MTIAAGGRVSLHDAPEAHPYPFSPNVSAHPGRHRVRLRYRADIPGGTPMELVSNTVDVTIAGGDVALWSCYNGPTRVPPPYDWMSHAPHQAIPFADGFVVLDRRERVHGALGRWRRWGAWWLYRVDGDGELRGDPPPLRGAVGHGDVQLLAIDDAVWLVAGAGQVLEAMRVGSQGGTLTLGAPVVWARDVLDPHRFAVTPGGALYFGREGLDAELRAAGDDTTLVGGIANARDEHGALLPVGRLIPNLLLLAPPRAAADARRPGRLTRSPSPGNAPSPPATRGR